MTKKIKEPLDRISIDVDACGTKLHLYDLCPCCLQQVKYRWQECEYCGQPLKEKR